MYRSTGGAGFLFFLAWCESAGRHCKGGRGGASAFCGEGGGTAGGEAGSGCRSGGFGVFGTSG